MHDRLNRFRHTANRSGFTLIEMLGTLSVLLAIGVSAVSILGSITEIGVRTNENRQGRVMVERLATTLRDDVHRAADIELSDEASKLTMTKAGTSIHYELKQSPPAVLRRVVSSDSVMSHERFQLPPRCRPTAVVEGHSVVLRLCGDQDMRRWIIEAGQP